MPNTIYQPSWGEHEEAMHSEDPEEAYEAGVRFQEERAKEMANSAKARDFEKSRKEAWAKEKPEWKKEKLAYQKRKSQEIFDSFRQLGNFKDITPAPGYILVAVDEEDEVETDSGIILATPEKASPNTGIVLKVGKPKLLQDKNKVIEETMPVEEGQRIIFKMGAGAYTTVETQDCRLMFFSDVLATIDE